MSQNKSITFAGTAAARAQTTLVSKAIDRPFDLAEITVRFPAGAQQLLAIEVWVSPDDDAPSTGHPTGVNALQDYSQAAYLRGDGDQVVLRHELHIPDAGMYLKLVTTNADWYAHAIDADIEIRIDPENGAPHAP